MGIRATNAKGADASPSGRLLARPRFQMRIDVKGTALKVDFRIRAWLMQEGTKVLCFRHKIALISPAIPAAASRCPILVFTEPIAQNCDRWVVREKACVKPSISIGSPRGVPVPCASI